MGKKSILHYLIVFIPICSALVFSLILCSITPDKIYEGTEVFYSEDSYQDFKEEVITQNLTIEECLVMGPGIPIVVSFQFNGDSNSSFTYGVLRPTELARGIGVIALLSIGILGSCYIFIINKDNK